MIVAGNGYRVNEELLPPRIRQHLRAWRYERTLVDAAQWFCVYCNFHFDDHARGGKCLFEPTHWRRYTVQEIYEKIADEWGRIM